MSTEYTTTGSPVSGYQSILTTTLNDTTYWCTAVVSTAREFNETIVKGMYTHYRLNVDHFKTFIFFP